MAVRNRDAIVKVVQNSLDVHHAALTEGIHQDIEEFEREIKKTRRWLSSRLEEIAEDAKIGEKQVRKTALGLARKELERKPLQDLNFLAQVSFLRALKREAPHKIDDGFSDAIGKFGMSAGIVALRAASLDGQMVVIVDPVP